MERRSKQLLLGAVTALPIPALIVCGLCVLVSVIQGPGDFGGCGVIFVVFAGVAVLVHTVMFFYYLINMQNMKAINPNHYFLWLLVLMVFGGQIFFWYYFLWKAGRISPAPG